MTLLLLWTLRLLGAFLIAGTLLPLVHTGKWWVRGWDMPRLQIAALLLAPIVIAIGIVMIDGCSWETGAWITACVAAMVWQVSHVIPLSPAWKKDLLSCTDGDGVTFKLITINLNYQNTKYEQVQSEIAAESAHLLLLIEFDSKWSSQLAMLKSQFEYHHEEIRGNGLGMAVWSKLPLSQMQTRFIISQRRPSIWAKVELPSGRVTNLVCIHPTPPGLYDDSSESRQDSRERDAELVLIAREIADHADQSWIVAGDFNDVAWSHTTRLFKRLSGMKDPRIGRSFMGTFPATHPSLTCPLDHVMLSEGFLITQLARIRITGSDHYGVIAVLGFSGQIQGVTPEPVGDDYREGQEIVREGKNEALGRDVGS